MAKWKVNVSVTVESIDMYPDDWTDAEVRAHADEFAFEIINDNEAAVWQIDVSPISEEGATL